MSRHLIRRAIVFGVSLVAVLVAWVPTATANTSATTTPVAGTAVFDTGTSCPPPPPGYGDFTDYPPLVMSGDLQGCWYTNVERSWDLGQPTGLYFEVGREVFVGRIKGGPVGTFSTVYSFESKWDPDIKTGHEVWGHCEHPIVPGSGTAGLKGVTGYIGFVDIVTDGSYRYSGYVVLPH